MAKQKGDAIKRHQQSIEYKHDLAKAIAKFLSFPPRRENKLTWDDVRDRSGQYAGFAREGGNRG